MVFDINAIYIPTTSTEEAWEAWNQQIYRNAPFDPLIGLPQDENLSGVGPCNIGIAMPFQTFGDERRAQPELILADVSLRCGAQANVAVQTPTGLLVVPGALIEMLGDGGGGGPTGSRKSLLQRIDEGITEWLARRSATQGTLQQADGFARQPVGHRGSPMDVPRGTNPPATIGGRPYGGHALDEMMSEGFTPSLVEDAIAHGQPATGASGRVAYYSSANNLTVIVENGRVITVSSGFLKVR